VPAVFPYITCSDTLGYNRRRTLEFYAMKHGSAMHDIIVELSNTNINYRLDKRTGWTPLHVAAKNNRERVVWHLLLPAEIPASKIAKERQPES
jgi:hypothetical protein